VHHDLYGSRNDTPDFPDNITGADAAATISAVEALGVAITLFYELPVNSTASATYDFNAKGIASFFGGSIPKDWGIFVTHNTGANLASGTITHTGVFTATN